MSAFDYWELIAYLGDYAEDYDIDGIIDEATVIDYATGNRFWAEDIDLAEICERHELSR